MSGCHSKNKEQMHSPLKTVLGDWKYVSNLLHSIQDAHNGYPPQRGGHPVAIDNLHVEDPEATSMDNNDKISGSVAIVALGGLEAEGNTDELLPSNQAKLTALTREINDLHQ